MKALLPFFALLLGLPLPGAPRLSLSATPLAPETKVEIIFAQAMVQPEAVGKTIENQLVTVKPTWPLKLTWRSPNILTLVPQEAPRIGATYRFSLSDPLTALDGTTVPAETFTPVPSEPLQVTRSSRLTSTRVGKVFVMFNDAVNPLTAAPFFQFVCPETKEQTARTIAARTRRATWGDLRSRYHYQPTLEERFQKKNRRYANPAPPDSEPLEHGLIIEPVTPLPIATDWSLRRLAELPNAAGTATLATINHYSLGDVIPFTAKPFARTVADQPRTIGISFNQDLPEKLSATDFLSHLAFRNPVKNLEATINGSRRSVTLSGDFESRDLYNLTLRKTLTSADQLALQSTLNRELRFKRLSPDILLPSSDQNQLASGSRTYQIQSINNQSLHLRIKRLSPTELVRASLGYRHYTGDGPGSERFRKRIPLPFELITGTTVADEVITIQAPLDTTHLHSFQWDQYLPQDKKTGTFFVSVTGTRADHPDLRKAKPTKVQALVQLTDLGLAWKLTEDSAFLYTYSCHSGKPLPGVELALFGDDARPFETITTGPEGTASLPRTEAHRLLRARLDGDTVTIPFDDSLPTVSMWRFPVTYEWGRPPADRRLVDLFTDRSLYRPGEAIHLKGIVRHLHDDELQLPSSLHPKLTFTDPRGNVLFEEDLTLSTSGSFDQSTTLPARTVGNFFFKLTWPEELAAAEEMDSYWEKNAAKRSASFTHRVPVQEFKRNTFEIESSLNDKLAYTLDARYFQGTPVARGKVDWFFRVTPTGFYPPNHRDFLFGDHRGYDPDYWNRYFGYRDDRGSSLDREGVHTENGEGQLDESGKLAMSFELPELKFPTPRRTSVQAEVTDANSQTLSTTAATTIHSSDFYLGLLRQDQISRVDEEIPFQIVAVTQTGELHTEPVAATLTIEREIHKRTKSKAPNGRVVVKNEPSLVPVRSRELTLSEGKLDLPFTPTDSGKHFFTLTARDASGRLVKTTLTRQIYGSNQYPWAYDNGLRIKLVPEKKRYLPGETARILVLSPIEGEALVTVEHQEVVRQFRTHLTLDNPVIEVPLCADDAPNAFISVLVIKGAADSKRKHPEPQLRLGYCDLTVEPVESRLKVALTTGTSETRPGEMITVSGTVLNHREEPVPAAEVTFYAVDEGTLAVVGYDNPDPLGHFHQPRALRLETGTSLGNFISESLEERRFDNKGFIIGGGGDSLAALYDRQTRSDFSPTAIWMPRLLTDSDGTFTARFQAPDTLTRYRLIAVAHHGSRHFGTGLGEALVNKPVMLEPSPPAFAHQGDRLRPKALLQNTSDYAGTWKVSLTLDSTTTANRTLMTEVNLPAQGQASLDFEVSFAQTGTAKWRWSAEPVALRDRPLTPDLKRHLSDSVESTFEVRYPMPLLREIHFSTLTKFTEPENLLQGFSPELLAGQGQLEVTFARSRLLEAGGAMDYLLRYPYGCAEQTTSSTIPWIAARKLRHLAPGFQKKSPAEIDAAIQSGADRLLGMQTSDGGFAYWSGGRSASDWISSYAGLGLILCREAGATVPQSALDRLASYLSSQLREFSRLKSDYQHEVYARSLYVLARLGQADPGYNAKLVEKAEELNSPARAFLALALHESGQPGWDRLLQIPAKGRNESGYWMSHRNAGAFNLFAQAILNPDSPECEKALTRLLGERGPRGHWRTTWNNAWSLLAMGAYAQAHETTMKDIHLVVETAEGPVEAIIPKEQASHSLTLPLTGNFRLTATSDARTYVQATLAARPEIAPVKPVSRKGLSVRRTYELVQPDGSSAPLTDPRVGDLVKVSLTLAMPDRSLHYLAIDDPLPSSFKAINTDFASQAGRVKNRDNWRVSHQEVRLDRVLFFVDRPRASENLTLTYHARITHAGDLYVPQTKVEEMYDPTSFALGASQTLTVK